jgi:hypothetical protein
MDKEMEKEIAFQNIKLVEVVNGLWNWLNEHPNTPVSGIPVWHAKDTWYAAIYYKDTPMPEDEQIDDYDM